MVVLNFVRNSATFLKFRSQNHNLGRICDRFSRNLEHWKIDQRCNSHRMRACHKLLLKGALL